MANVIIDDKHLYDIGDALRGHYGETTGEKGVLGTPVENYIMKTDGFSEDGKWVGGAEPVPEWFVTYYFSFPGAARIEMYFLVRMHGSGYVYLYERGEGGTVVGRPTMIDNGTTWTFNDEIAYLKIGYAGSESKFLTDNSYGFYASMVAYDADGNPVAGGLYGDIPNTYKPREMAAAVSGLFSIPPEALVITGICDYRFSYNGWNWLIDKYGNQITTNDITSMISMFTDSYTLSEVPFTINTSTANLVKAFYNCNNLKVAPHINFLSTKTNVRYEFGNLFNGCCYVRDIEHVFDAAQLDFLTTFKHSSAYQSHNYGNLFSYCCSLRKIPSWFYKLRFNEDATAYPTYTYVPYYNAFNSCYALDEITNIPVIKCSNTNVTSTTNMFSYTFNSCGRAKNITFETQANGSPYVITNWKNQTIDLSNGVGFVSSTGQAVDYNSGITRDKCVSTTDEYAALKNDEDWFTTTRSFSRYNHDSAVNTIKSLPDCSTGNSSNNAIKFQDQGNMTDGGGTKNLTDAEIAVAAAKGWTVSIV